MSAFGHDHGDCFDLTGTKARFWHRHGVEACQGSVEADLRAAGLTVVHAPTFWHVRGPGVVRPVGLGQFDRDPGCGVIWTALSGKPDTRVS